jgi:hypothetical protein
LIVIENDPVPYVVPVELELFLYDRVAVTDDRLSIVFGVLDHSIRAVMYLLPVVPVK